MENFISEHQTLFMIILALVAVWTIFWKGWALWLAARNDQKVWFLILLVLNTLAILDILYVFVFSMKEDGDYGQGNRNFKDNKKEIVSENTFHDLQKPKMVL